MRPLGHLSRREIFAVPISPPVDVPGAAFTTGSKSCDRFRSASHQTCNNQLLRRCHELLAVASGPAVIFPHRLKQLLQEGLEVRDRRDPKAVSATTAPRRAGSLRKQLAQLTEPRPIERRR